MMVIIGAIKTAALAAEVMSAPSRKPNAAVFHCPSWVGFVMSFANEGIGRRGSGRETAVESFDIVLAALSALDVGRGCCCSGMSVAEAVALRPAGQGLWLAVSGSGRDELCREDSTLWRCRAFADCVAGRIVRIS
jgi:hypothetical protein